jgi:hypothetical protein
VVILRSIKREKLQFVKVAEIVGKKPHFARVKKNGTHVKTNNICKITWLNKSHRFGTVKSYNAVSHGGLSVFNSYPRAMTLSNS